MKKLTLFTGLMILKFLYGCDFDNNIEKDSNEKTLSDSSQHKKDIALHMPMILRVSNFTFIKTLSVIADSFYIAYSRFKDSHVSG